MTYAARITALPLSDERIDAMWAEEKARSADMSLSRQWLRFARAIERETLAAADTELTALRARVGELERADEYEFVVYEGDTAAEFLAVAASGTSSNLEELKKEAAHYAAMYSQDGPVTVEFYAIKRTKIDAAINKESA